MNFMRQSKILAVLLVLGIVCGGMTGCGGNAGKGKNGDAASGGAVSGTAVSGGAVETEEKNEQITGTDGTMCFCTDTNKYYRDVLAEKQDKIMQMRWDGTDKKEILSQEEIYEFYGVAAGWLYYQDVEGIISRIPIAKDEDGYDVVKEADKENLYNSGESQVDVLYADEQYMFCQKNEKMLVKYDLSEHKKVSEWETKSEVPPYIAYQIYIYRLGTRYAAFVEGDGIYAQQEDEKEWSKVSDSLLEERKAYSSGDTIECMKQNGDVLFYVPIAEDDKSLVCAFDGEKETEFISNQSLQQAVRTARGFDDKVSLDVCVITNLFGLGERLYVQVQLNWKTKEEYHMEYMLFSQGLGEDALRYEKELTECMWANGQNRTGKWGAPNDEEDVKAEPETVLVDSVVCNDAQCIAMIGGRVYISCYDYKNNKGRLVCCELSRWGDCSDVKKGDLLYIRLYDDGTEFEEYESVYYKEADNFYMGFSEGPTVDDSLEGMFYETKGK